MSNLDPLLADILRGFTTVGDTLTKKEKRQEDADELWRSCESVLADLACAMDRTDEMAGDDDTMADAYSLMEKAHALVSQKLAKIEAGEEP
tara:strand:- start:1948 stop:2220 length:273 start_codon:yes stop_codon:yes gene_type:complete